VGQGPETFASMSLPFRRSIWYILTVLGHFRQFSTNFSKIQQLSANFSHFSKIFSKKQIFRKTAGIRTVAPPFELLFSGSFGANTDYFVSFHTIWDRFGSFQTILD
jgi:hypothetical protein